MAPFGDVFHVILLIGGVLLALLWFFVPFAIFGTKSRLDDLIDAVEETNKQLADIKAILTPAPAATQTVADDIEMPSIRVNR